MTCSRTRGWTLIALGVLLFIALDLLITGLGDPPSIVPPVTLDENTGVPPVPTNADFPYDRTNNVVAIVLLGGLGCAGLVIALREGVRRGDWMPLFLSMGTVIVVVPEVFVDVIGMVYYPVDGSDHAFDLFGRQMGWFILAGWFGAGAFAAMMIKALLARPTAKQVWVLMGVTALSYTIFEELLVGAGGIYHYYGNQPMWWNNLPLWWTPCNAIGCALLPAAFAYRYQAHLTGWRASAMLLVVPASVAGAYAFIAMPSWIVVNGDYGWFVTELAGLATWGLGVALIAIIMNLFLGYQPFDPDSRPWEFGGARAAGADVAAPPGTARPAHPDAAAVA
ncbi:MAG: hypothetical protein ACT4P1_16095 [Sporichthyaceae bacterium]